LYDAVVSLDAALDLTRTGDLWLFRGRSTADQAIRAITNAPVNHVGMAVVLDDLPPLLWHAELGRGLPDVWAGGHHRGAQLHDLASAVEQWSHRYNQQTWMRQLDTPVTREMEDSLLRTIARTNGTPFPATAALGQPLAAWSAPSPGTRGVDVLRGGGRRHVPGDGAAVRGPADELLRPREVLVRRRAAAGRRRTPWRRDPGGRSQPAPAAGAIAAIPGQKRAQPRPVAQMTATSGRKTMVSGRPSRTS
jgi:hypothetical protein